MRRSLRHGTSSTTTHGTKPLPEKSRYRNVAPAREKTHSENPFSQDLGEFGLFLSGYVSWTGMSVGLENSASSS
jgi:hypothetical protein